MTLASSLAALSRRLRSTHHGSEGRVEVLSTLDDFLIDHEDQIRTKHARTLLLPELFESATREPPTELYNLEILKAMRIIDSIAGHSDLLDDIMAFGQFVHALPRLLAAHERAAEQVHLISPPSITDEGRVAPMTDEQQACFGVATMANVILGKLAQTSTERQRTLGAIDGLWSALAGTIRSLKLRAVVNVLHPKVMHYMMNPLVNLLGRVLSEDGPANGVMFIESCMDSVVAIFREDMSWIFERRTARPQVDTHILLTLSEGFQALAVCAQYSEIHQEMRELYAEHMSVEDEMLLVKAALWMLDGMISSETAAQISEAAGPTMLHHILGSHETAHVFAANFLIITLVARHGPRGDDTKLSPVAMQILMMPMYGDEGTTTNAAAVPLGMMMVLVEQASRSEDVKRLIGRILGTFAPALRRLNNARAQLDDGSPTETTACARCGSTSAAKLRTCGRCKMIKYCSKECQQAHWTAGGHKQACLTPAERSFAETYESIGYAMLNRELEEPGGIGAMPVAMAPLPQMGEACGRPGCTNRGGRKGSEGETSTRSQLRSCSKCRSIRYCGVEW
mmetsp:Transcript_11005/g.25553  ORF Transcript_11005/g.25553 Transcript_11005/m.25553 type:complete len:567 (-) Transcript_11005:440-2140(-)